MRKSVLEQLIACEQAPGWVQGEIAECSLGEPRGYEITMLAPAKRILQISYLVHEIRAQGDSRQIIH